MLFATIGQQHLFLWMLGAGILSGLLYTVMSLLRRLLQAGFWLSLVIDLFYGLGCAVILLTALITGSYGRIYLYEILGAWTGLAVYLIGPHRLLLNLISASARRLCHIIVTISRFRLIKVIFK